MRSLPLAVASPWRSRCRPWQARRPAPRRRARATATATTHDQADGHDDGDRDDQLETPVPVPASNVPPAGRRLSADQVLAIAERLPKMRAVRRKYPGSYGGAYLKVPFRWQVSFFSRRGKKEIGQVIIEDLDGRVVEQWTGFQIAWTMARGYPGAFGRHVNSLYVWLPLCLLFLLPFFNFRRPLSLLHLDLLVLLSFSVSLASSTTPTSTPRSPSPIHRCCTCSPACSPSLRRRSRAARASAPAAAGPGPVAGDRDRLPARLPDRPQRDRFERHRRRLRRRDRAQRIADRRTSVRRAIPRQRTRRHLRPRQLRDLCPVRAGSSAGAARWDHLPAAHAAAIFFDLLASRRCSCSAAACAAPRSGSRSPTPGSPIPSRSSPSRATRTTRSWGARARRAARRELR